MQATETHPQQQDAINDLAEAVSKLATAIEHARQAGLSAEWINAMRIAEGFAMEAFYRRPR